MNRKGLSHSDAEGMILPTSAYLRTAEGKSVTKKSHIKRKSADKIGGFQHLRVKIFVYIVFYYKIFRGFCSALNEADRFFTDH